MIFVFLLNCYEVDDSYIWRRVSPLPSKKWTSESDEEDQCMYGRFYSTTLSGEGRQEGHGMFELSLSLSLSLSLLLFSSIRISLIDINDTCRPISISKRCICMKRP